MDISEGNRAVELIKEQVRSTFRPEVLGDLGGFSGAFLLPNLQKYRVPVLLSGADGVGTKLKLAFQTGIVHSIGQDLVAMCANDILVQGAEPLFFLDYFATSKVIPEQIAAVVSGIAAACREIGCALIGGETAELPGFYQDGEFDLAGFIVGIADLPKMIDGRHIVSGDVLLGLPSSGLHSNGFALVNHLIAAKHLSLSDPAPWDQQGQPFGQVLLTPTKLYVTPVLSLLSRVPEQAIKGMVHITGGGFIENIPRVLPLGCGARILRDSWPIPPVFHWLRDQGIAEEEMLRTFNNGIGYVLVVARDHLERVEQELDHLEQEWYAIGDIIAAEKKVYLV